MLIVQCSSVNVINSPTDVLNSLVVFLDDRDQLLLQLLVAQIRIIGVQARQSRARGLLHVRASLVLHFFCVCRDISSQARVWKSGNEKDSRTNLRHGRGELRREGRRRRRLFLSNSFRTVELMIGLLCTGQAYCQVPRKTYIPLIALSNCLDSFFWSKLLRDKLCCGIDSWI